MSEQKAPKWCPDAVATDRGWASKETSELYVSKRGLEDVVSYNKLRLDVIKKRKGIGAEPAIEPAVKTPVVEETPVVSVVSDKPQTDIETPVVEEPAKVVKKTTKRKPAAKKKATSKNNA